MKTLLGVVCVVVILIAAAWSMHLRRRAASARAASLRRLGILTKGPGPRRHAGPQIGSNAAMDHRGDALPYWLGGIAPRCPPRPLTAALLDELIAAAPPFKCPRCDAHFDTVRQYENHVRVTCAEA